MTRGQFQFSGSGTFQTDSASRLVPALAAVVVVILVVEWIADRIWWILGGTAALAVLGALAVLAVRRLIRWQERREAAYGEQRAAIRHGSAGYEVDGAPRCALGAPVHIHFHGIESRDAAEVVRRAIEGN